MTMTTLRPNATVSNLAQPIGGDGTTANAWQLLLDDSDSTYMRVLNGDYFSMALDDFVLPAGDVIKAAAIRLRTAKESAEAVAQLYPYTPQPPFGQDIRQTVSWGVPTTTTIVTVTQAGITVAALDGLAVFVRNGSFFASVLRVYEMYVDVTHVEQPIVTAEGPTGTVDTTNQPVVEWSNTLDPDGGAQTTYQVKVFSDAEYLAGGFDPDTSVPTAGSEVTAGAVTSWQINEALPDDTYRAYVRVAQTVNGVLHWSDWDNVEFAILVDLPAAPTLTLTVDNENARIQIDLDDNAGDATTDYLEVQRSLDSGVTWETVRQLQAGRLTPVAGAFTLFDYEAPNGLPVEYRARALHDYSGLFAASAWVQDGAAWSSSAWWLKHPHLPELNVMVTVRSFPQVQRAGRFGAFQPLGATHAVVVSDTRGPVTGAITFAAATIGGQDELDLLLDQAATLLLQAPADERPPGYVQFHDSTRARIADWARADTVTEQLTFTAVAPPPGDVVAWPS